MEWVYDDGGRSRYFKAKGVGDCVCRSVAIATGRDYKQVYDDINALGKQERKRKGRSRSTARDGVDPKTHRKLMEMYGWEWVPTMGIGTGCKVHLNPDELPSGRIVCRLSRHSVAVIDGVVHDTYDPTKDEGRCVYGYWTEGASTKRGQGTPTIGHEEFARALEAVREDFEGGGMSEREFAEQCLRLAHERSGRPYERRR